MNREDVIHRISVASLVLMSFFVLWVTFQKRENLGDDSLITLTYAKNIAQGRGFVYNHPPATLGTTTPLWTLSTGLLGKVAPHLDITHLAVGLSAMCWVGWGWVFFLNRRFFGMLHWEAAIVALVFFTAFMKNMGNEVLLFQLLLLISFVLFLRGQWLLCGAATGLLFLTRGEGILLPPLLGAYLVCRVLFVPGTSFREVVRPMLWIGVGCGIILGIWSGYALYQFGAVVPNTLQVKIEQGRQIPGFGNHFLGALLRMAPQWDVDCTPIRILYWFLALVGAVQVVSSKRVFLLYAAWGALYTAGYSVLQVPGYYGWYRLPVYFLWLMLLGFGATAAIHWISRKNLGIGVRFAVVAVLLLSIFGVRTTVSAYRGATWEGDTRAACYKYLAAWMREHSRPEDTVATFDVGYMGYYTENRILDLAGLVSPEVSPMLVGRPMGDDEEIISKYHPEYLIKTFPRNGPPFPHTIIKGTLRYESVLQHPVDFPWLSPSENVGVLFKRVSLGPRPRKAS